MLNGHNINEISCFEIMDAIAQLHNELKSVNLSYDTLSQDLEQQRRLIPELKESIHIKQGTKDKQLIFLEVNLNKLN